MKNKGFTLVELLAVIILLSIIALIAVPKVLEQKEKKGKEISEAKKKILYTDAATYLRENNEEDIEPGQVFCLGVDFLIDEGYNAMDSEDYKDETVKVTVDENGNFVYSLDDRCSGIEFNNNYKDAALNGADPVLKSDMIPVTIDNDGTVKRASKKSEWYNYDDKKWANTIVLLDNTNYKVGDTIPEDKIKAYYVWIPRYKYKLFSNTPESSIEIVFDNKKTPKSSSTTIGEYLTHPAFTYGDEELSGFWVGKFEPSVETSDACYIITEQNKISCNKEHTNVRIIPNSTSLKNQVVSNQYKTSHNFSKNSNMMKNDEWGAVAYLSYSKYGINGKIRLNNSYGKNLGTGCGAESENNLGRVNECQIEYGKVEEYPQSTTGNITGIFDMSGGHSDRMMAVLADKEGNPYSGYTTSVNSGFNGPLGNNISSEPKQFTEGIDFPNSKDYNLYYNPNDLSDQRSNSLINNVCGGSVCYGHAFSEVKKTNRMWDDGTLMFITYNVPWVNRGGSHSSSNYGGIFDIGFSDGGSLDYTFRVVVR